LATNTEDGCSYAFAKGNTATTLAASSKVVPSGSAVLIEGTITDSSPAQAGTPAVSDESMTDWMEYIHMQKPVPTNTKGVPVRLSAIDSNGNSQDIATVTSNTDGSYSALWTPTNPGTYTIVANFEGTNSYYPSNAQTVLGVNSVPTPMPSSTPTATTETRNTVNQMSVDTFYIFAALVVALMAALIVVVIMTRKK